MKKIALTIDVETDWGGRAPIRAPNKGIEQALPKFLKLLTDNGIRATFFICSNLLPKYKRILQSIPRNGHEVASHAHSHQNMSSFSVKQFRQEAQKSAAALRRSLRCPVKGFRAPQFSIRNEFFPVLHELGFSYDSSLASGFFPGRYQNISLRKAPFLIYRGLTEIPVSRVPYTVFPLGLTWLNALISPKFILKSLKSLGSPVILYFHPFDLVQGKGEYPSLTKNIWYHYREKSIWQTLEKMILFFKKEGYSFVTMQDLICQEHTTGLWPAVIDKQNIIFPCR